jgi:parallel beta-helix repeat protein
MKLSRILVLILALAVLNFICVKTGKIQASPSRNFTILDATGKHFQSSFVSIQQAIDEAENGSTIYVPSGLYKEHVIVNKTVRLVGMDISATIVDGSNAGTVMQILADNVSVSNFTLQNSGWGWYRNGVYVYDSNSCRIESNYFLNNCHNVRINCSYNSVVSKNTIKGSGYGIRLINSVNCTAVENNVSGCIGGVHLENATNCVVKKESFCPKRPRHSLVLSLHTQRDLWKCYV